MSGERKAMPADSPATPTVTDLPAGDLADLWNMLDVLPRVSSSVDMAATTIDMVAVAVGGAADRAVLASGSPRGAGGLSGGRPRWLLPAAAVCASLVAGVVVGRMTASDPDVRILEYLPLIRHVGTLQEAGTPKFLKALATRRLPLPFRFSPDAARDESREFDEAVRDLESDHVWGSAARPLLADRRAAIDTLSGDERDALERAAATFQELTTRDRRDLVAVAAALADPTRQDLRDAARAWHLLIAASDPAGRKNIVELDDEGRLEWIDRRARLRDWERGERRGLPQGGGAPGIGAPGIGAPGAGPPGVGPQGIRPPGVGRGDGRSRGEFGPRGDGTRGEMGPRGERAGPRPAADGSDR